MKGGKTQKCRGKRREQDGAGVASKRRIKSGWVSRASQT